MNKTKNRTRKINVPFKLIVSVFAIILLVIAIQTGLSLYNSTLREQAEAQRDLLSLYEDYNNEADDLREAVSTLSLSFADRSDIQRLLVTRNRAGMVALLTPIFEQLETEYNITRLAIHETDGTNFVQVHNPAESGDLVTYRRTVATALQTQQTIAGLEVGSERIGIYSVSPLFDGNDFIGLVEVGLDYNQAFIDQLKVEHNANFNLWIREEAAAPAGLEPSSNAFPAALDDLFFYLGTTTQPLPISSDLYASALQTRSPDFVSLDNFNSAVLVAPLLGYNSQVIGILEISQSRSEPLSSLRNDQLTNIGVAILLAVVALGLVWLVTHRVVLKPLSHLTNIARQQLEGNLKAQVEFLPTDEFGELGQTLNAVTSDLDEVLKNQESIIAERTNQLEVAIDVARQLSSILALDELLAEVVNLIHDRFDLYHTHIYLLNEDEEKLVVVEGYGEAGAEMKSREHSIPLDARKSLVAQAARSQKIVRVDNVRQTEGWLPNPLLPETHSEMAIPVVLGQRLLGVLDVQSDREANFNEADEDSMLAVANNIAVSIYNAQRFEEVAEALTEAEKIQQIYVQERWQPQNRKATTYQQVRSNVRPVEDEMLVEIKKNIRQGETVILSPHKENGQESNQSVIATPLAIREQVIGHIRIHETEKGRRWNSEEIALVKSISEQMSLAIENARLFETTQQRAMRERVTREITDKMRAAPDVGTIVQTGLAELSKILDVPRVYVKLTAKPEQIKTDRVDVEHIREQLKRYGH